MKIFLTILICVIVFMLTLIYFVKGDSGEFKFTKDTIIIFLLLCIAPCFLEPWLSIYLLPLGLLQLIFGLAIIANLKKRALSAKKVEDNES